MSEDQAVQTERPSNESLIETLKEDCFARRTAIEAIKTSVRELKCIPNALLWAVETEKEYLDNVTLAYRHLEDARMRLGKAVQALDGGASCYPR